MYCINDNIVNDFIEKNICIFIVSALVFTCLIFISYIFNISESRSSLFYLQKLAIASIAIHILSHIKASKILDVFARYSFPLYFIHYFVNFAFGNKIDIIINEINLFVGSKLLLHSFFVITISLVICIIIRKIFGKYSKYIFGY